MASLAAELMSKIAAAKGLLQSHEAELRGIQSRCAHQFERVIYNPVITEGHRVEGDPPGTMGIDRQMPFYIPRSEVKQWSRTCNLCKLTQVTQRTKVQERSGSMPGTIATEEAPDFGDR